MLTTSPPSGGVFLEFEGDEAPDGAAGTVDVGHGAEPVLGEGGVPGRVQALPDRFVDDTEAAFHLD